MNRRMIRVMSRLLAITIFINLVGGVCTPGLGLAAGSDVAIDSPSKTLRHAALEVANVIDSSASSWAVAEIQQAYDYGLTYPDIMNNFKQPITREEFCTIAVRLYQKMTGQTVVAGESPFTDTTNPEVIKAYQLGIVKGTGPGQFSPKMNITRQEICVMILRVLDRAISELDKSTEGTADFTDQNLIAAWAIDAVRFASKNGIMKGVGGNRIDPLGNTAREQAIVLVKRTYEAFRPDGQETEQGAIYVGVGQPAMSEQEKMAKMDVSNRLAFPVYDTRLKLLVATKPGRPSQELGAGTLPIINHPDLGKTALDFPAVSVASVGSGIPVIDPKILVPGIPSEVLPNIYSASPNACFIDRDGDKKRWFSFSLNNAPGTTKVVWQVSKVPFMGFADDWKNPPGLVASGQVDKGTGEFAIDFSSFTSSLILVPKWPLGGGTSSYQEIPKAQRQYYVRAVPVDASGNCIGDPGEGLSVLYGKPLTAQPASKIQMPPSFELWSYGYKDSGIAKQSTIPESTGGEFPQCMQHRTQGTYYNYDKTPMWFEFYGFDSAVDKITLQVSTKKFDSLVSTWEQPAGLVYSKPYTLPVTVYKNYPNAVPVAFQDFALSDDILGQDGINYYVRAVALKPTSMPGTEQVLFSDTVTIKYGPPTPVKIYTPPVPKTVPAYAPTVKLVGYAPARWEWCTWPNYYVFTRTPHYYEMDFSITGVPNVGTIHPFNAFKDNSQQYQDILNQYLKPGAGLYIVKKESQKSWWGKLWDAICDFFEHIADLVAKVVNWVSSAYNNLLNGLIDAIANLPLLNKIPHIKEAINALVTTGLASIGIPRTLPNFDELTSGGLGYLASVALSEAGIPENQYTKEMVEQLAGEVGKQVVAAAATPDAPNPLNKSFLKNDPSKLYRPAYIDLLVTNPYQDRVTPSGSICVDVTCGVHNFSKEAQGSRYYSVLCLDANRNAQPYWDYPVFFPVRGQPLPSLPPGASMTVRIYLKEYYGQLYPWNPPTLEPPKWGDFCWLYSGSLGPSKFNVNIGYNLGDIKQAAQIAGIQGESLQWDSRGWGTSFTCVPHDPYTP